MEPRVQREVMAVKRVCMAAQQPLSSTAIMPDAAKSGHRP